MTIQVDTIDYKSLFLTNTADYQPQTNQYRALVTYSLTQVTTFSWNNLTKFTIPRFIQCILLP